jgi:hypothetical protein
MCARRRAALAAAVPAGLVNAYVASALPETGSIVSLR